MESFDNLPLACIVNNKFFSVHGGISPNLVTVTDLKSLNRFSEPPTKGLFCDLLWTDPIDSEKGSLKIPFKPN